MTDEQNPRLAKALARYQVISGYLALAPKRGQRRLVLEELASRRWPGPDGEPFQVAAETIRAWPHAAGRRLPGYPSRRLHSTRSVRTWVAAWLVQLNEPAVVALRRYLKGYSGFGACRQAQSGRPSLDPGDQDNSRKPHDFN